MIIKCPLCRKDDQIRKISGIILSESKITSTKGTVESETTCVDGFQPKTFKSKSKIDTNSREYSCLVDELQPPKIPTEPMSKVFFFGCLIPIVLFLGIPFGWIIIGSVTSNQFIKIPLFTLLLLFIAFVVRELYPKKKYKEVYKLEMERYYLELEKWERSYYCYRDHLKFDPKEQELL